jgi:hypothetical protein
MESGRLYPGSPLDLTCAMVSSIARRGAEIVADVSSSRIGCFTLGPACWPQLGMGGDERGESERPERAAVVGHQDHRGDLTALCIGDSFKQPNAPPPDQMPIMPPQPGLPKSLKRNITNDRQHTSHSVAGTTTASAHTKNPNGVRAGQPHPAADPRRAAAHGGVEVRPMQSWHAAHLIDCRAAVGRSVDEQHDNIEETPCSFCPFGLPDQPAPGLTSTPAQRWMRLRPGFAS